MNRSPALVVTVVIVTLASGCASAATSRHQPHPAPRTLPAASERPATPPPPPAQPRSYRVSTELASWRLPTPLSRGVVIGSGTGAVLAGGLRPGDVSSDLVYRIGATGLVGHRMPPLAQSLHDAAGTTFGGRPVILGGGNTSEVDTVESLSSNGKWRVTGRLPRPSSDLSAVSTSHGIFVIGGYDGVTSPRPILGSSDGQHFTTFARLRYGVRYAAVVRVGDSIWVIGGEARGRELNSTQVIELTTRRVRVARRLPTPLGHAAAALIGSRILLMGGRTAPDRITNAMWWLDTRTGRYSSAGQLPYPVADAGVLDTVDGAYLLGGEIPQITNRVVRVRVHS